MKNLKLSVRNIIGDSVKGYSRVTVNIDAFEAMRQSIFARRNKETPLLSFLHKTDEGNNLFYQFFFDEIEVRNYFIKDLRKTILLMKTQEANKLLNTEELEPVSLSSFDLNSVIVV